MAALQQQTPTVLSSATLQATMEPPAQTIEGDDPPVKKISSAQLKSLGQNLNNLFQQYRSDRRIAELRWLRDQRQYLGLYDPDVEKELSTNRSKAYPRVTRIKCISVLARLMNLMFPGNEQNWEVKASPSPDMSIDDVKQAIQDAIKRDQEAGAIQPGSNGPELTEDYIAAAVQRLADKRADKISTLIKDQLEEIGGDQTYDWVQLNRRVIQSGIQYGIGCLEGPYIREVTSTKWMIDPQTGEPSPQQVTRYKPLFEFLTVWDFYPDLSAKTLKSMDGYFTRKVMSHAQVRALARRPDFFEDQVLAYLNATPIGNYRPQPFELELRVMGVKVNVNEMKTETMKYEVIVWHGAVSGEYLILAGCDVPQDKRADDLDAEIWLIDGNVIKATLNPWRAIGADVRTLHTFLFDEDDTSPIGFGLPNAVRDSQMAIAAAARMLLDNASVVCGPNLELNTDLLRGDQDLTSISAYKVWYREGLGQDSQWPAVRNIEVKAYIEELQTIIELFMKFADAETFVGPATGGDTSKAPSEPMRTAAGASMLRGDAALPFKDVVRSFDSFTQSVIDSVVQFNRKFNPDQAPEGDYNIIARGATSLIAKEMRGIQLDSLAQTMLPEEKLRTDMDKFTKARYAARDLQDMLLPPDEVKRAMDAQNQQMAQQAQQQQEQIEAMIRKTLADAYKNIAQGNKNAANADAASVSAALDILERALGGASGAEQETQPGGHSPGDTQASQGHADVPAVGGDAGMPAGPAA